MRGADDLPCPRVLVAAREADQGRRRRGAPQRSAARAPPLRGDRVRLRRGRRDPAARRFRFTLAGGAPSESSFEEEDRSGGH